MTDLQGTPSDDLLDVLAAGRTDVTTVFVSMSGRDPEGRDREYLEWHAMDHAPEQRRLSSLRGALRIVSTPACRAARAVSTERYDAVDHVMTYLFAGDGELPAFRALGAALGAGGRMSLRLPSVEVGVYELAGTAAAPRVLVGADVVPWRPATGVYLLVELGTASPAELVDVPGVAGVWWFKEPDHLQLTYCFLDDDPVAAAGALAPVLERRWNESQVNPLLAAPFQVVVPDDLSRHLP